MFHAFAEYGESPRGGQQPFEIRLLRLGKFGECLFNQFADPDAPLGVVLRCGAIAGEGDYEGERLNERVGCLGIGVYDPSRILADG